MVCRDTETELTLAEARALLEPYFIAVRDEFVAFGLAECKRTRFECANVHDAERHFAGCRDDGLLIALAPELLEQPPETVLAIVSHEFGHATDFLYPGEFVWRGDDAPALRQQSHEFKTGQWHARLKNWRSRSDDVVERSADAIAHAVQGVRYGYLGPCYLQTFGATGARPQGLR